MAFGNGSTAALYLNRVCRGVTTHMKKKIKFKSNAARNAVLHANRWLNNYDDVIWLIGDGRSGTTWVSDLINHDKKYREMFEPFHPKLVDGMGFLLPHQYVRAHETSIQLEKAASDVFSGKLTHKRVDSVNRSLVYKGLLIKDIFANLFSYWASVHFPKLKIILLIRNPFSVALSKYITKNWFWVTDPMVLLNQADLYEDYLYQFEEIIRKTSSKNDYILNQVLIWSIINYVPLRQFKPGQIHIVFYEQIYADPSREISRLFRSDSPNNQLIIDEQIVRRPSRVAGEESNILRGISPVSSWKNVLTVQQIDAGFKILEEFGFEKVYGVSPMPNRQALYEIHRQA